MTGIDTAGASASPTATAPEAGETVLLVINPDSGGSDAAEADSVIALLRERVGARGAALKVVRFDPGSLRHRLDPTLRSGASRLFVAGGDGTVIAVVEALEDRRIPLGIIPRGTMNWVARDLGIPLDPAEAIDALVDAPVRDIDLGTVNGRPFLCACMIGLSPLLARWRERERGSPAWKLWPKILWRGLGLLLRYRHLRMSLTAEGRTERLHSRTLVVTNNLIEESFGPMPRRPRLDAGLLGIYGVRKATPGELTRLGTRLILGNWQGDDAVLTRATAQSTVAIARRRAITLILDGERTRLKTPLRFAIRAGAVRMLTPGLGT